MTFTLNDLWHAAALAGVLAFMLGWVLSWMVAMRYGEQMGRFALRREQSQRPLVAMTRIPPGVSKATVWVQDPTAEEAEAMARSWPSHPVLNG